MAMSLTEDFKTLEELSSQARDILKQIGRTGRPVHITVKGKPAAVLVDVATFERMVKTLNMARLLLQGEVSLNTEGSVPLEVAMRELYRVNKISR